MASNWLRLECKAAILGWTSELPAEQYAAWVKMLQVIKAFGEKGGRIHGHYFSAHLLKKLRLSRRAFDGMLKRARAHADLLDGTHPVTIENGDIVITAWPTYQLDTTRNERQARHRGKKPIKNDSAETARNACNECNADVTGRDVTGRDKEKQGSSEFPSPESLLAFTLAYFQVFPRREQEKTAPLRLRGWDADGKHRSWQAWAISQSSELLLSLTATDLKQAKAWAVDRGMAWGPYTLVLWLEDEGKRAARQTRPSAQSPLIQKFYEQPSAVTRKYLVANDNNMEKAAQAWKKEQEEGKT